MRTNLKDEIFKYTLTTLQTEQMSLPAQKATPSCLQFHTSPGEPFREAGIWKMSEMGSCMVNTTGFISKTGD